MANMDDKRDVFAHKIKVNITDQNKAAKRIQFSSNNKNSSIGNLTDAPDRQRSLVKRCGNEK